MEPPQPLTTDEQRRPAKKKADQRRPARKKAEPPASEGKAKRHSKEEKEKLLYETAVKKHSAGIKLKAAERMVVARWVSRTTVISQNDAEYVSCGIYYCVLIQWTVNSTADWYNCDVCGAELCQWCQNTHQNKCKAKSKA